jgi:hypothetical protein
VQKNSKTHTATTDLLRKLILGKYLAFSGRQTSLSLAARGFGSEEVVGAFVLCLVEVVIRVRLLGRWCQCHSEKCGHSS